MRGHHHLVGMALVHPENSLENKNHEFARRIVVVEQDHLPQRWPLRFWFRLRARLFESLLVHGEPRLRWRSDVKGRSQL